jgi:TrmH family RNA methyltransferase
MKTVTSLQNPTLKLARKLMQSGRERQRSNKILLDGPHLVSGYASRFGWSACVTIFDESAVGRTAEIASLASAMPQDCEMLVVPEKTFRSLSPVETPSGVIAICDRPEVDEIDRPVCVHLLLDGIQNPGNLGSILRTAAATGITRVLLSGNCADAWSPKCLRGGMGAQFVMPTSVATDPGAALKQFQGKRIATSSHDGQALMDADLTGPLLLLFGGEGSGLPAELMREADFTVRIPLENAVESLNVGAAVAMVCYERMRQVRA